MMRPTPIFWLSFLVLAAFTATNASAMPIGTYDWSTATAGNVLDNTDVAGDNNDGWQNFAGVGNGSGDFVETASPPTGFSGNFFTGDSDDDLYLRPNDAQFSYSIPSNPGVLELSAVVTANSSTFSILGLRSASGEQLLFGNTNFGTWGFRRPSDTVIIDLPGSGAAALDGTLRSYRVVFRIDWTPVGSSKLVDLVVENLVAGTNETIFSNLAVDFGAAADASVFDQLQLRAFASSVDEISMAMVPEPSTAFLMSLGLVGLGVKRRNS